MNVVADTLVRAPVLHCQPAELNREKQLPYSFKRLELCKEFEPSAGLKKSQRGQADE
jgi:hypothetical protein